MFQTVHTKAGSNHKNQNDKHRGRQLLAFAGDDCGYDIQRIVIGIDLEQTENTYDAEHTECGGSGREEDWQEIR